MAASIPDAHRTELTGTHFSVVVENENFLRRHAKNVLDEIIELINDAIDQVTDVAKRPEASSLVAERAVFFYACHVLMPSAYSILANVMIGGIPSCVRELRLMVEAGAKCYLADQRYSAHVFFAERMKALEEERRLETGAQKREIDWLKEFDNEVGLNNAAVALWGKLSRDSHARRQMEKIVEVIAETGELPAHALSVPMSYRAPDLIGLRELNGYIRDTRQIIKGVWRQ